MRGTMARRRGRRIGIALAALLALPAAAPAAPPGALIDRVIAAYGGRPALERVRSVRMEGEVFAVRTHFTGPTVRVFQRPDRLKVLMRYPVAPEMRIVDGRRGWRMIGDEPLEEAQGPLLDAMVLQAARADLPWILLERRREVRAARPDEENQPGLAGLELSLAPHLTLRVWVDPRTDRVVASEGALAHGGMETRFETRYSDWRRVEGIWFAFREENHASGTLTGHTTFEKIELNVPIAPDAFTPPRATVRPRAGAPTR